MVRRSCSVKVSRTVGPSTPYKPWSWSKW